MATRKRIVITARQVTRVRLEPVLKERLREISGEHGYQTLIRTRWSLIMLLKLKGN